MNPAALPTLRTGLDQMSRRSERQSRKPRWPTMSWQDDHAETPDSSRTPGPRRADGDEPRGGRRLRRSGLLWGSGPLHADLVGHRRPDGSRARRDPERRGERGSGRRQLVGARALTRPVQPELSRPSRCLRGRGQPTWGEDHRHGGLHAHLGVGGWALVRRPHPRLRLRGHRPLSGRALRDRVGRSGGLERARDRQQPGGGQSSRHLHGDGQGVLFRRSAGQPPGARPHGLAVLRRRVLLACALRRRDQGLLRRHLDPSLRRRRRPRQPPGHAQLSGRNRGPAPRSGPGRRQHPDLGDRIRLADRHVGRGQQ